MVGSILANEQDERPIVVRDEVEFSGEGLPGDQWGNHLLFEEPMGSMLISKVHVFSDSLSVQAQVR